MLQAFDLFSLQTSSMLASLAFGLVFAVMWRGRSEDEYFKYCALSSLIYAATLLTFRLAHPISLAMGCGLYGLLTTANILGLAGLRHIDGRAPFSAWMLGLIVSTMSFYGLPVICRNLITGLPPAITPISHGLGLIVSMGVVGTVWLLEARRSAGRGAIITGGATIAYIPGYIISIFGELGWGPGGGLLSLIPMLSDQLLLGVLNLGLAVIAMPPSPGLIQ